METIFGLSAFATFILLFGFLLFYFLFLLIGRPFVIWYLKLGRIVNNQEYVNGYLSELVSQNEKLIKELSKQRHNIDSFDLRREDLHRKENERYMPK